jgi:hypothetical protein
MKNLNEQIERINMISNYQVGVAITEQVEKSSNFETGKSYKYQFIDSTGKDIKTPVKLTNEYGEDYELPSSGTIKVEKVYGNYTAGPNVMADFEDRLGIDLQSQDGKPNLYSHPDFNKSKVLVKLFPN